MTNVLTLNHYTTTSIAKAAGGGKGPVPKTPEVALCPVELSNINGPQNAPKYTIRDPKIKLGRGHCPSLDSSFNGQEDTPPHTPLP